MDVSVFIGWRRRDSLDDEVEDSDVKEATALIKLEEREEISPDGNSSISYKIRNLEIRENKGPHRKGMNPSITSTYLSKEELEEQLRSHLKHYSDDYEIVQVKILNGETRVIRRNVTPEYASHLEETLLDHQE